MKKNLIYTVYNQKGGIGKSTFSVNFAHALVQEFNFEKVLIVDNDGQGNSTLITTSFDDDEIDEKDLFTIYDLMTDEDIDAKDCYIETKFKKVYIVPATIDHVDTADDISNEINNTGILLDKLEAIRMYFDAIIVDCSPSIDRTTKNALLAGDVIITPMESSVFSNKGLRNLLKQIGKINKKRKVPALHYSFLSKVNNTRKVANIRTSNALELMLDENFIKDRISLLTLYSKSFEEGYTAINYKKDTRGNLEMKLLVKTILDKVNTDFVGRNLNE